LKANAAVATCLGEIERWSESRSGPLSATTTMTSMSSYVPVLFLACALLLLETHHVVSKLVVSP
jgi:hypothetical protein